MQPLPPPSIFFLSDCSARAAKTMSCGAFVLGWGLPSVFSFAAFFAASRPHFAGTSSELPVT